jgi:anti-anti-sigma regulatory factor
VPASTERARRPTVVVDVVQGTLLDSALLTQLVRFGTELRLAGGELVVVCGDPELRRLLRTTRLDSAFVVRGPHADAHPLAAS